MRYDILLIFYWSYHFQLGLTLVTHYIALNRFFSSVSHNSVVSPFQALRCIGDLIDQHPKNIDELATKVLGEEPQVEPALNSILRIILRTSSMEEFVYADYVFKNFCEVGSL